MAVGERHTRWAYLRTSLLFFVGLCGVIYEAALWGFDGRQPDPTLSLLFAAMMGISVTTWPRDDEKK